VARGFEPHLHYPHKSPRNKCPQRGFSMAKPDFCGNGFQAFTLPGLPPEQKIWGSNPLGNPP